MPILLLEPTQHLIELRRRVELLVYGFPHVLEDVELATLSQNNELPFKSMRRHSGRLPDLLDPFIHEVA